MYVSCLNFVVDMLRCFILLVVLKRIGSEEIYHFAFYEVIEVAVSFFGTRVFPNQFLIRGS